MSGSGRITAAAKWHGQDVRIDLTPVCMSSGWGWGRSAGLAERSFLPLPHASLPAAWFGQRHREAVGSVPRLQPPSPSSLLSEGGGGTDPSPNLCSHLRRSSECPSTTHSCRRSVVRPTANGDCPWRVSVSVSGYRSLSWSSGETRLTAEGSLDQTLLSSLCSSVRGS